MYVVQFPHPGAELNPGAAGREAWNTGKHRRKFLQARGFYVAEDGAPSTCHDLVFWGEWEAPSYVFTQWKPENSLPCFLHRPVWERPTTKTRRLNTDPWVFGESFRFSNCRQLTSKGHPSALQRLTPGSLILFGSTIGGGFALDTVFVVRDACPFSPAEPPETDEAFRVCTVESLRTTGNRRDTFTLYRGASYEAPINGMYSFVPCRRADADGLRFPRPCISLAPYVNPRNWRTASGATKQRSPADVHEQWKSVRRQVLDQECLLGVRFSTPQLDENSSAGTFDAGPAEPLADPADRRAPPLRSLACVDNLGDDDRRPQTRAVRRGRDSHGRRGCR